jgi:hypothetical protein
LLWEAIVVKKFVVLLMTGMLGLASRGATAQDLFASQTLGDLSSQMTLPDPADTLPSGSGVMEMPEQPAMEIPSTEDPIQEPLTLPSTMGDLGSDVTQSPGREMQFFDCEPALLESTGTWLRRGFWFAEVDAVLMNRRWDRRGRLLMQEDIDNANPIFVHRNMLSLDGTRPGAEGAPRLTLGRFLFRDESNRDHNVEFVAFGGGNWSQDGRLDGTDLVVPIQLAGINPSFSGATSSQYRYDSWFNSFELNYHLRQRMLKDRMELEPSGQWVRRAQPTKTYSVLAGMRYFNLDEHVNWQAFGIDDSDDDADDDEEDGVYDVQVGNHMIGTHMGLSSAYETARWSIEGRVKGGMFLNMIDLDSSFDLDTNSGGTAPDGSTDLQGDKLAWIGEAAFIARYHIRPNFSLRAGLEVMHLASLAFAPNQIDFVPSGSPYISMGNEAVYLGGSIGFESYW